MHYCFPFLSIPLVVHGEFQTLWSGSPNKQSLHSYLLQYFETELVIRAIILVFLWMVCYNLISMDESSESYFDYCLMVFQSGFFPLAQSPHSGTRHPSSIKCFVIVLLALWHTVLLVLSGPFPILHVECKSTNLQVPTIDIWQ